MYGLQVVSPSNGDVDFELSVSRHSGHSNDDIGRLSDLKNPTAKANQVSFLPRALLDTPRILLLSRPYDYCSRPFMFTCPAAVTCDTTATAPCTMLNFQQFLRHSKVHAVLRVNSTDGERSEIGEGNTNEFRDEEVTRIVVDDGAEPEHSSTRSSGVSGAPPTTQASNPRRCVGPGQARGTNPS